MKDLLICVLALTWVLVVIRQMGTRRHPREVPEHIDRDFRDLVSRVSLAPGQTPEYLFDSAKQETFSNGR